MPEQTSYKRVLPAAKSFEIRPISREIDDNQINKKEEKHVQLMNRIKTKEESIKHKNIKKS